MDRNRRGLLSKTERVRADASKGEILGFLALLLCLCLWPVQAKAEQTLTLAEKKAVLYVGVQGQKSVQLHVKASGKVRFKSDQPEVASVSQKGLVKGRKRGTARITAYLSSKKSVKAVCRVTVKYPALSVQEKSLELFTGEKAKLTVAVTPKAKVSYESRNPEVASVKSAVVQGVSPGKTKILVRSPGKTKKVTVTVKEKEELEEEPLPEDPQKPENPEEEIKEYFLQVGERVLPLTLEENEAARALRALFPLTVQMEGYGGFEQVGSLGRSLPAQDERLTTQPGDLILYNGSSLVLFYGSNTWAYTRLGKVSASQEELRSLLGGGPVTVRLFGSP